MAQEQGGFELEGRFYPFADIQTMSDMVLIQQLTGLDGEEYTELLSEAAEEFAAVDTAKAAGGSGPALRVAKDARVMLGLVGLAFWRQHPAWTVDRVTRHVQKLDIYKLKFHSPEGDDGDAETPPSAPTPGHVELASAGASAQSSGAISEPGSESHPAATPEVTGEPI